MTAFQWAVVGLSGGAAALLVAEHYLTWHRRAWFRAHPPAAYTLGLGTLFGVWTVLAGWFPATPAPLFLEGCFVIAAGGGLADVAVWWWHRRQQAAEVTGLAAIEGTDGDG